MVLTHEPGEIIENQETFVVVIKDSKKLYRVIIRKRGEVLPVGLYFLREEDEFSEQVGEDFIGLDGEGVALEVCHGVRKLNVRVRRAEVCL